MADELVVKKEGWVESTRQYLTDIRGEMKRVTWPGRDKVESTTLVVIASVFAFAVFFKVVDMSLGDNITRLYAYLVKL